MKWKDLSPNNYLFRNQTLLIWSVLNNLHCQLLNANGIRPEWHSLQINLDHEWRLIKAELSLLRNAFETNHGNAGLKWKWTSNNSIIFLFECSMWSLIVAGGWITCNSIDGFDISWITLPYFSDDMHVYTTFSCKGLKNKKSSSLIQKDFSLRFSKAQSNFLVSFKALREQTACETVWITLTES